MKIAYVGNFTQSHCTEVHLSATLQQMGHNVVELQENKLARGWVNHVPDDTHFLLYTRTWGEFVSLEDLQKLKERGITTVSYHLDLYVGLSRKYLHGGKSLDQILQTDPFWRTDFVFTPDGDPKSAEVFERNGVNHLYMKPGVFKSECVPALLATALAPDESPYKHEVLFVGGGARPGSPHGYGHPEWPYRDTLIGWLQDIYGPRFTKFGFPEPTIRNAELNQLYRDSKVVVGDSVCVGFEHSYYWSDRVYETIGRGGFLIHPYIEGLDEEFTDGETIVFYEYGNFDELKQKIDYYLEHEEERERIRVLGQNFVKNNATYHERMAEMLAIVGPTTRGHGKAETPTVKEPVRINLGAGSEPTEGWVNVDWIEQPGIDIVHNLLVTPWPLGDDIASHIKAIDVLEHMPNFTADNKSTPIAFIEECHRILRQGGELLIQVPHWQSKNLWIDPTHVRGYDERSFDYFDPETDFGKWYGYYSDKKFRVTSVRTENDNVQFTMVKL